MKGRSRLLLTRPALNGHAFVISVMQTKKKRTYGSSAMNKSKKMAECLNILMGHQRGTLSTWRAANFILWINIGLDSLHENELPFGS